MSVLFPVFMARFFKVVGLCSLIAAVLAIPDGEFLSIPFFLVGGYILITRNPTNNTGIRGTTMEVLGLTFTLLGAGAVAA